MSNLARYFLSKGKRVGGYDRVETKLTRQLQREGAFVHHVDDPVAIPAEFIDKKQTLVVYTPAVPASHRELTFFQRKGVYYSQAGATAGRGDPDQRCRLRGGHAREDHRVEYDCPSAKAVENRLQRLLGGSVEKLRQQPAAV